jgi:hypothetical protein
MSTSKKLTGFCEFATPDAQDQGIAIRHRNPFYAVVFHAFNQGGSRSLSSLADISIMARRRVSRKQ